MKELIETWEISHRMNEFLLMGIKEDHLNDIPGKKGRSVGEQFAHIHNVRVMWVQAAAADLLTKVSKIEKEAAINKHALLNAFEQSTPVMADILRNGFESGRIKGFKPHPQAFLGYLVAHEAHHRGQIILTLKENEHMPDKKILYGLWEWGVR